MWKKKYCRYQSYTSKFFSIITSINKVQVMISRVPCCNRLVQLNYLLFYFSYFFVYFRWFPKMAYYAEKNFEVYHLQRSKTFFPHLYTFSIHRSIGWICLYHSQVFPLMMIMMMMMDTSGDGTRAHRLQFKLSYKQIILYLNGDKLDHAE